MALPRTRILSAGLGLSFIVGAAIALAHPIAQTTQASATQQVQASARSAKSSEANKEVKAYTLPPDLYDKAVRFSRAQYILYFVDFAWGVIVLLLILAWRLAPRYRNWAEGFTKRHFLQAAIFTPILLLTISIFELPTGIYGHWLNRSYGLSIQGWGSWLGDWAKGEIIFCIVGILLAWILYAIIRRSPRRWWFHFWVVTLPFLLLVTFLTPLVIDPLFNKFEPLESKDPALVTALERVVHRGGMDIPPERMYWMQESAKGNEVDAYVTGLGGSKRVVVWDTTVEKMTVAETMYVFGHEMGHYVLNHVYKGLAFGAALSFVLLFLGFRGMLWSLARWSSRWGIRSTDDWASLPVLLLWITILGFLASPMINGFSRLQEHHADQYGLEVTHGLIPNSSQVAAQAFQILGEVDLADPNPNPFIKFWLYSHPPLSERVDFALKYNPWAEGKQPEFVK
ncbi:MAG TPA: M48 family metallopeptidase [Candidatus Acidoferrales bacterium]|nr:M48 family metallopeptidase [Candidatus Acidoferrales bacterium]